MAGRQLGRLARVVVVRLVMVGLLLERLELVGLVMVGLLLERLELVGLVVERVQLVGLVVVRLVVERVQLVRLRLGRLMSQSNRVRLLSGVALVVGVTAAATTGWGSASWWAPIPVRISGFLRRAAGA